MIRASERLDDLSSDLRHLVALLGVITDMAIDAPSLLPASASPNCRGAASDLSSLVWIARDLASKLLKDMEAATEPTRMTGGARNG